MPHEPRRKGGQAWGRIARFVRRKSSAPSPDVHSRRRVPRARQHFRRRSWHTRGGVWYRQTIVGIAAGLHLGHNAAAPRPDANAAERIVDVVDNNVAMRRSLAEAGLLRQNTVPFAVKCRFNFSNLHPTAGRVLVARSRDAGNGWSRSSSSAAQPPSHGRPAQ